MDTLLQDLRYGVWMLMKNPGFTLIAALVMALGIGANTAIFSIVDTVLLRPLPFHAPDRLVLLWGKNLKKGIPQNPTSFPNFVDWKSQSRAFEDMAAWTSYANRFNLTGGDEPEQVHYALVSANFFSVLKVQPVLGCTFQPEDDRPDGPRTIVISHSLWQRRFGADPAVIGKAIPLDGQPYTIIGVLPASFTFVTYPRDAEVWVPLALDPFRGRQYSRGTRYLSVIARLKPGVTVEQAQRDMGLIAHRLEQDSPDVNAGWGIKIVPLHEQVVGDIRPALRILLGTVGFVLLIACANVANLLLARATARQKEIAIRAALGAGRGRLIRQLLTESVLLALLGGSMGVLLALWGLDLLTIIPYNASSPFIPYRFSQHQIGLNGSVLVFTFLLSLLTGVLFGLAPALQISKLDLNGALKEGGTQPTDLGRHRRIRSLLVVFEVALSLVLLIGAGLMVKSFMRLQQVNPGFNPEHVLTADIGLPSSKYPQNEQITAFYQRLLERLSTLPGARSVGAVTFLPLSGTDEDTGCLIEGRPPQAPGERLHAHPRVVSPGYFRTMEISIRKGRPFTDQDRDGALRVAIINETMARRFWPDEDPIGKRVALDYETLRFVAPNQPPQFDVASVWREVVGVVADVKHGGLGAEPVPEMYIPYRQGLARDMSLVIRATTDPASLANAIRSTVFAVDKDQPVANVRTLSQLLSDSVARPRSNFLLLGLFAVVALALAMVGVYGVIAYSVTQRTHEIGVRMALGAGSRDVLKLIMGQSMITVLVGVGIGVAGALAVTRVLSSWLYGVTPTDPTTFGVISLLLTVVTLLASYLPARRATRVDPMVALRYE